VACGLLVGYESGDDQILLNIKKGYEPISHAASVTIAVSSTSRSTAHSFLGFPAKRVRRIENAKEIIANRAGRRPLRRPGGASTS
jgi:hypothetical protein